MQFWRNQFLFTSKLFVYFYIRNNNAIIGIKYSHFLLILLHILFIPLRLADIAIWIYRNKKQVVRDIRAALCSLAGRFINFLRRRVDVTERVVTEFRRAFHERVALAYHARFPSANILPFANSALYVHVPLLVECSMTAAVTTSSCILSLLPLVFRVFVAVAAVNSRDALLREIQTLPENRNGGRGDRRRLPREYREKRVTRPERRDAGRRRRVVGSRYRDDHAASRGRRGAGREVYQPADPRSRVAKVRASCRSFPRKITGWRTDED